MNQNLIAGLAAQAPNRRSFLQKLGLTSAALTATATTGTAQTAIDDVAILQFALNLEYLEAEFYTVATTGRTIDQLGFGIDGAGAQGATTGGSQVRFTRGDTFTEEVANEIAADERAHVRLLRGALQAAGVTPVAKPPINLNALGVGFGSQEEFLLLARAFEDVGVSAYAGAAPLISNRDYVGVAARILAAEALHTGNIRLQVARQRVPTAPPLDGVDILPPPSGTRFISVDNNGLVAARTPGQVLFIVYGNRANATSGGFYPGGVNGTLIRSSSRAS